MVKTLTVDIPDDVSQQMDKYKGVEWSDVCKRAIKAYIDARAKVGSGTYGYDPSLFEEKEGFAEG